MDSAPQPQPQFLTSNPSKPFAVATILHNFAPDVPESQRIEFADAHDNFRFHHFSDREKVLHEAREGDKSTGHQSIIICSDGRLPERHLTPSFDLGIYYQALSEARKGDEASDKQDEWSVGDVVLYGEAVASTQTMLAKYVVDCVGKTHSMICR
jgi:biotin--protein ligase